MFFGFSRAVGDVGMRAIIVVNLNAANSLVSANKELYFVDRRRRNDTGYALFAATTKLTLSSLSRSKYLMKALC